MIPVDSIIKKNVVTCLGQSAVIEAVTAMVENAVGSIVVTDDEKKPIGIFTERDLLTRVVFKQLSPEKTPIQDVMTKEVVVAEKGDSCSSVYMKMKEKNVRHIPVVDETGNLMGVISISDVTHRMNDMLVKQSVSPEYLPGVY
ncbi:MAG: CBS domain-containing protein [Planctomycetes bacterium]|jgi:CBS domain-containing protein|nr:CBS domain-containing protein [Planctomycetota bacterium]HON45594.1 CBS domain-containing protein [Planctomycetota bacterium]HPY75654.1 CBS domain-containing protein [Planctomycetota bacterium]HQB00139.1 CBS domain-containing protein [Planctomycetota bacterium]HRU51343.1 CBS domain-containing protein [Planctomycetota bacterium]